MCFLWYKMLWRQNSQYKWDHQCDNKLCQISSQVSSHIQKPTPILVHINKCTTDKTECISVISYWSHFSNFMLLTAPQPEIIGPPQPRDQSTPSHWAVPSDKLPAMMTGLGIMRCENSDTTCHWIVWPLPDPGLVVRMAWSPRIGWPGAQQVAELDLTLWL